jgi:hypothetical protein
VTSTVGKPSLEESPLVWSRSPDEKPSTPKEASMSNLTPPVTVAMLCAQSHGAACTSTAAGHGVSAIRDRVTAATPSKWLDAIVTGFGDENWVELRLVETDQVVQVWNHRDLGALVTVGDPVALHGLYDTLAIGSARVSVLQDR